MENLRAKIREFGGLVETDDLDPAGIGTQTGIGGHHAVHVGPDFDTCGVQAGSENCRRKIRAATADRGRDTRAIGSDEASHDRHFSGFQQGLDTFLQSLVGLIELRNCFGVTGIGEKALTRIDVHAGQSAGHERGGHNFAGKHFAE